jgi:hypothetical protein
MRCMRTSRRSKVATSQSHEQANPGTRDAAVAVRACVRHAASHLIHDGHDERAVRRRLRRAGYLACEIDWAIPAAREQLRKLRVRNSKGLSAPRSSVKSFRARAILFTSFLQPAE